MRNKIVFDFDQTYISINSFPYWVIFVLIHEIIALRWRNFFHLIGLLFQRKLTKKITHIEFKKEFLEIHINSKALQLFCRFIQIYENKEITSAFHKHLEVGDEVIISSAAPNVYLKEYFKNCNVQVIGAFIESNGLFNENHGELKKRNLYQTSILTKEELILKLYTDSYEDLPLGEIAETIVLVQPNAKTLRSFDYLSDRVSVIK